MLQLSKTCHRYHRISTLMQQQVMFNAIIGWFDQDEVKDRVPESRVSEHGICIKVFRGIGGPILKKLLTYPKPYLILK